jgi:phosphate/sulfate permease
MMLLALATIIFSLYDFVIYIFSKHDIVLEMIFKPIIALTLSIAIFDLAKTILEQEVFFKSYSKNSRVETKLLTKFLTTIIIALSIEALIVVFKIAINDYDQMINAFYLIAGIALILISLTVFIYFSSKRYKQTTDSQNL